MNKCTHKFTHALLHNEEKRIGRGKESDYYEKHDEIVIYCEKCGETKKEIQYNIAKVCKNIN